MADLAHYERLADLFEYPGADFGDRAHDACRLLEGRYPAAAAKLQEFSSFLPPAGGALSEQELDELQEIFTRSFDVQSVTTLGVGYVMFGDDYKRGEVLVNLNREHRDAGIECGSELPDHLPNVLRLLARWRDRDLAAEFVQEILYPALKMMIEEFDPYRMEERNRLYKKHFKTLIDASQDRGTMYCRPLAAVVAVLREDFELSDRARPEHASDFLGSIGREMAIEVNEGRPENGRQPK